jgi:exonuclease VII large subunit
LSISSQHSSEAQQQLDELAARVAAAKEQLRSRQERLESLQFEFDEFMRYSCLDSVCCGIDYQYVPCSHGICEIVSSSTSSTSALSLRVSERHRREQRLRDLYQSIQHAQADVSAVQSELEQMQSRVHELEAALALAMEEKSAADSESSEPSSSPDISPERLEHVNKCIAAVELCLLLTRAAKSECELKLLASQIRLQSEHLMSAQIKLFHQQVCHLAYSKLQ